MNQYHLLTAKDNIDADTQCRVRFVYGGEDAFYLHNHDYYEIFLVTKGTVSHVVNNVMQALPVGTFVLIRPHDIHSHICDTASKEETCFINFAFTQSTAEQLLHFLFCPAEADALVHCPMPPSILLNPAERKRMVSQISQLNIEQWHDKQALKRKMRILLTNMLPYFVQSTASDYPADVPEWLSVLVTAMSKPENFTLGIDQMIALSGKSREHVSRCFQKFYGSTITDYLNDLRINYASNLLINTNMSIMDICFDCGFQSMSYFYRVFKQKNGSTPLDFRNRHFMAFPPKAGHSDT